MTGRKASTVQPRSVEELVATYAAAGLTLKQQSKRRHARHGLVALTAAGIVAGAGYLVAQSTDPQHAGWLARSQPAAGMAATAQTAAMDAELARAAALQAELAAELAAIRDQRAELREQRAALAQQQSALAGELEEMAARRAALREQQDTMAEQSARLANAIATMEADRNQLLGQRQQVDTEGPALEAEIQALSERRKNLDDERKRFRAQRDLLQHELNLLNEQRATLEEQQQALQEQWLGLQEILDKVAAGQRQSKHADDSRNTDGATGVDEQTAASAEGVGLPEPNLLMASSTPTIDTAELGQIRGGFDMDGDLDIAIGLTRSVNINGIEEYASQINLGDMSSGQFRNVSIQPVLIQNGSGNTVATSALGAPGDSIPVFIQNTLDNQRIVNTNVYDITVSNFAGRSAMRSVENAISESLIFQN